MKLTTIDELTDFNDLLDSCRGDVFIGTPDGRTFYDMRDRAQRLQGIVALTGRDADLYGIYPRRRDDEMMLMGFICRHMQKKTA